MAKASLSVPQLVAHKTQAKTQANAQANTVNSSLPLWASQVLLSTSTKQQTTTGQLIVVVKRRLCKSTVWGRQDTA